MFLFAYFGVHNKHFTKMVWYYKHRWTLYICWAVLTLLFAAFIFGDWCFLFTWHFIHMFSVQTAIIFFVVPTGLNSRNSQQVVCKALINIQFGSCILFIWTLGDPDCSYGRAYLVCMILKNYLCRLTTLIVHLMLSKVKLNNCCTKYIYNIYFYIHKLFVLFSWTAFQERAPCSIAHGSGLQQINYSDLKDVSLLNREAKQKLSALAFPCKQFIIFFAMLEPTEKHSFMIIIYGVDGRITRSSPSW